MLSLIVGLALVAGAFGQYKWDPSGQYRLVPDDTILRSEWTPKFFENRLVNTPIELIEPWRTFVMGTIPVDTKLTEDMPLLKQYTPEMLLRQYKEVTPVDQYKQYKEVTPMDQYKQYKEVTPMDQYKQYKEVTPMDQYKQYIVKDQYRQYTPEGQYKTIEMVPKQYKGTDLTPMARKTVEEQYKELKEKELKPEMLKKDMMMMEKEEEERCMNMGVCTMEIIERIKIKSPWMLETLCKNKGLGCMERQWYG